MFQKRINLKINWAAILVLLIWLIFTAIKVIPFWDEHTFINFSSDTQRQLYLYQDIYYSEEIPNYNIENHVEYPVDIGMAQISLYSRGGHTWWAAISKATGIDIIFLINVFSIFILLGGAAITYQLTQTIFNKKEISLLASFIFLWTSQLVNITPHNFVAFFIIPTIIYGLLKYLEKENQTKYLILYSLTFYVMQIMHSNYATLFLIILISYVLFEELNRKNKQFFIKLHKALLISFLIYIASFLHYYIFTEQSDFWLFLQTYTGVWATTTQISLHIQSIGLITILSFAFLYNILRTIKIGKFKQFLFLKNPQKYLQKHLKISPKTNKIWWQIFMGFLIVLLTFLIAFLKNPFTNVFPEYSQFGSMLNIAPIVITIIILFKRRSIINQCPNLIIWLLTPFFFILITSLLAKIIPFFKTLTIYHATPAIIDFSLPWLAILGGYSLYLIISNKKAYEKIISTILVFLTLQSGLFFTIKTNYELLHNTHLEVIESYFLLKPLILEEHAKVGSSFEYIRSFTHLEPTWITPNKLDSQYFDTVNIAEFITDNNLDYFVYSPWLGHFPHPRWIEEISNSDNLVFIYTGTYVGILKNLNSQ